MRVLIRIASTGVLFVLLGVVFVSLGVSVRDAVLVSVALGIQAATGRYVWRLIRGNSAGHVELLGMGLTLGTVASMLSGIIFRPVLPTLLAVMLPSVVVLVFAVARFLRSGAAVEGDIQGFRGALAAISGFVVGLGVLVLNLQRYPLQWQGTWDQYHRDMLFFEGLGNGVARFGANDSIFMLGADIRYHWFAYAWTGQLTESLGLAPFVALTRVLPVVSLLIAVTLVIALVQHLMVGTNKVKLAELVPWIAVLLVVTGGYVGAVNGTILNFDSPSQALSAAWLLSFVLSLLLFLNQKKHTNYLLVIIAVMSGVLTGSKISTGAVALGSVFVLAVIGSMLRLNWTRKVWIALLSSGVVSGLVYFVVIAGSASPGDLQVFSQYARASTLQGLDSSATLRGVFLGTVGLTLAMAARWVGTIWLVTDRGWRSRPEPWLAIGFVLMSLIPLWVFSQGLNETWFGLAASGPLAAFSAVGLWIGWRQIEASNRLIVLSVISAAVSIIAVSYVWTDQVWESGFGRFYAPYLGYVLALIFGILLMLFHSRRGLQTVLVIVTTVLVLQGSVARSVPILGALFGGARDGFTASASELADISIREDPAESNSSVPTAEDVLDEIRIANNDPWERSAWSELDVAAASFLSLNAQSQDVVVTNETLSYLVPALTGLRTYMSGAGYQGTYGSPEFVDEIRVRVARSREFLTSPSTAEAVDFYSNGIRWVWASKSLNPNTDWTGIGEVAFANDAVEIVRINTGGN